MRGFFMDNEKAFSCSGKRKAVFLLFCLLFFTLAFSLSGNDEEANKAFLKGRELEKKGEYQQAASCYKDARLLADDLVIKGNSLIAAARSFRKAAMYGEEFDCLERLIRDHLNGIDFSLVTERQYEIGDLYFRGHRDTPVKWLPFLQKDDRTIEVYEAALSHAPCAGRSPEARLRLARLYIEKQNMKKAMHHLTETGKLYAGTKAAHDATLELASLLFQFARNGDGDNAYGRRTLEVLDEFEKKYPDSPERYWVKKRRQQVLDIIAKRLDAIGNYYKSIGRKETASQYFAEIVKNYSDTCQAAKSEEKLAELEKEYKAAPRKTPYVPYKYPVVKTKGDTQYAPVKISPEENSRKWLLPVRDLKKNVLIVPGGKDAAEKGENHRMRRSASHEK